jgi:hypothetical protein
MRRSDRNPAASPQIEVEVEIGSRGGMGQRTAGDEVGPGFGISADRGYFLFLLWDV